jgi:hypothetical protein
MCCDMLSNDSAGADALQQRRVAGGCDDDGCGLTDPGSGGHGAG